MPYTKRTLPSGKVRVTSPHGVKAKRTTKAKADALVRLLRRLEYGWKPKRK